MTSDLELYAVGWLKHDRVQHFVAGPSFDRTAMDLARDQLNLHASPPSFVTVKLRVIPLQLQWEVLP